MEGEKATKKKKKFTGLQTKAVKSLICFKKASKTFVDNAKDLRPHCVILTGDFHCRSNHWWPGDKNLPEGIALGDLFESYSMTQLIDQPADIEPRGISCVVDLIVTDKTNLFIDHGIHSLLDNCCHHQIIHVKLNVSVPLPPPYKRQVWNYSEARVDEIRSSLRNTDWTSIFVDLTANEMTNKFTILIIDLMHRFVSNQMIKCDGRDPPWITPKLKTAIKRKRRVYNKCIKRGRKPDEWEYVRQARNETSAMITNSKDDYFAALGRKLSNSINGPKIYWTTLNKIINRKK